MSSMLKNKEFYIDRKEYPLHNQRMSAEKQQQIELQETDIP